MATHPDDLYVADFYAWTRHQSAALRRLAAERWNGPLDLTHLAEEVEDLGDERRNAVRSQLRRIIEHCLKLEFSPTADPRAGWMRSIANARGEIADRLTATIRRDLEQELPRLYVQALRAARLALIECKESNVVRMLPAECSYVLDDLLADDWHPVSQQMLVEMLAS